MKALSIMQPWAHLIVHGGKNIENRTWITHYRGPLLIHAGLRIDARAAALVEDSRHPVSGDVVDRLMAPMHELLDYGGVIGMVDLVGIIDTRPGKDGLPPELPPIQNPWWQGPVGFVLANPRRLPFLKWRGQQGLFDIPDDAIRPIGRTT